LPDPALAQGWGFKVQGHEADEYFHPFPFQGSRKTGQWAAGRALNLQAVEIRFGFKNINLQIW